MTIVFALLLLALVLAFVGYPLLRPAPDAHAESPATGQRDHLLVERENVLATLKDLEMDHSIGNLSRDDYDALRTGQRHRAVAILRELDEAGDAAETPANAQPSVFDHLALDTRLEDEIAAARQRLDTGEKATAETRPRCPVCNTPHAPAARFCSDCGTLLSQEPSHDR